MPENLALNEYQFSLKHLMLGAVLFIIAMSAATSCYQMYENRVRAIVGEADLQFNVGKRVWLRGRYQCVVDDKASFHLIWAKGVSYPILIDDTTADNSPHLAIHDGDEITVTGRIIADRTIVVPVCKPPGRSPVRYAEYDLPDNTTLHYRIVPESVHIMSDETSDIEYMKDSVGGARTLDGRRS